MHLHVLQRPKISLSSPSKNYQRKKYRQQRVFCWSWPYVRTHLFLYAISQNVNNFGRDQFSNIKTKVFSNEITDIIYWHYRTSIYYWYHNRTTFLSLSRDTTYANYFDFELSNFYEFIITYKRPNIILWISVAYSNPKVEYN